MSIIRQYAAAFPATTCYQALQITRSEHWASKVSLTQELTARHILQSALDCCALTCELPISGMATLQGCKGRVDRVH